MKKILFSKKEYKELLQTFLVGKWVCEAVNELRDEDNDSLDKLENNIITSAKSFGLEELTCKSKITDTILPSENIEHDIEGIIEDYTDDVFWNELTVRFGKRDFYESLSLKEKEEIKKASWLPEKIHDFYAKYEEEFDENGIENLRLKKD